MLNEYWEIILIVLIIGFFLLDSPYLDIIMEKFSSVVIKGWALIVFSNDWGLVADRLDYRDFYKDIIETSDGWFWTGIEIRPISTDGFNDDQWNSLGKRLNHLFVSLPENTWIQIITRFDKDVKSASDIYYDQFEAYKGSPLASIALSRGKHLEKEVFRGNIRSYKTYVFVGIQAKAKITNLSFKEFWEKNPFIDLEKKDFLEHALNLRRIRDVFARGYWELGGYYSLIDAQVVFDLAYRRLNPTRSKSIPTPIYNPSMATKKAGQDGIEYHSRWTVLPENPRETLSLTNIEVKEGYFLYDGTPCTTIILKKLPTEVFAGLMERISRDPLLNFEFEICTSYQIENYSKREDKFEISQSWMAMQLGSNKFKKNKDEQWKYEEIEALREELRKGTLNIGFITLGITFEAKSVEELKRRIDRILLSLRKLNGAEGILEKHCASDVHLATLPCTPHRGFRTLEGLSRDAIGLSTLTNGQGGLFQEVEKISDIYQRTDGGLFNHHFHPDYIGTILAIYCGPMRSGKSGKRNCDRLTELMHGKRGLTVDFGGSSERICMAVGGRYVDMADLNQLKGLGLFAVRPLPGEVYEQEELIDGLSRDRLADVEVLLEALCLDNEKSLPAVHQSVLRRYIKKTYLNRPHLIPGINDFISMLDNCDKKDIDIARDLAARLEKFGKDSVLGNILNDNSAPIPVDCPYTVFNLGSVKKHNPQLQAIQMMGVVSYINRFLRISRTIPKFLDFDELNVIADNEFFCNAIDNCSRTAGKAKVSISFISQSPLDFKKNEKLIGIKASANVLWLFNMSSVKDAQNVFELSDGMTRELSALRESADFKDCLFIYPDRRMGRVCVPLRLRVGPLERKLAFGGSGGDEKADLNEAMADIYCEPHPFLINALNLNDTGMVREAINK